MSDTQTLIVQLFFLAVLGGLASWMLFVASKIVRDHMKATAAIAKRFPVLISMLGVLVVNVVALVVAFSFGGA